MIPYLLKLQLYIFLTSNSSVSSIIDAEARKCFCRIEVNLRRGTWLGCNQEGTDSAAFWRTLVRLRTVQIYLKSVIRLPLIKRLPSVSPSSDRSYELTTCIRPVLTGLTKTAFWRARAIILHHISVEQGVTFLDIDNGNAGGLCYRFINGHGLVGWFIFNIIVTNRVGGGLTLHIINANGMGVGIL